MAKEFNDVQLDVEFTQASSRTNLTSKENISLAFGKLSKWYEALVPTGGSSGQFLGWNSDGTAKWVSNPNVDTKVTSTLLAQSTAAATYLPTFVSAAGNSGVNIMNSFSFRHTVGTTSVVGNSRIVLGNTTGSGTANNEEGQIILYSSSTSYHTIRGSATTSAVTHILPTTGGTILNTGTTSFTQTLKSGTKVGTITIGGSATDIYCETNTNTDTLVSQTFATADHNRPLLMSYYDTGVTTTTAQIVHRNDALYFNPSGGVLRSPRLYLQTTGMPITINLDTLQPAAGENVNVLAVRYKNTDGTATHMVYPIGILGNDATGSSANYNSGVRLGSTNGTTIIGAGESSVTFAEAQAKYNDEHLYFVADGSVYMYTNCSNDSTTVTGPWRVGGFTTGTAAITSGRVMITDGTAGGFKASDYTIAKSVPSDAKFSDTTYSAGTGLSLSGTTFNHSNSVTAETTFDKTRFKYDAQGHITSSSYYVHTAAGTGGVAGWIKIATMKHIKTYDNTPIELTLSQRGNHLTYRLHILFKSANGLDPDINKFIISMDTTDDTGIRAYIIKSATSTWDLYILKRDSYEAIAVSEFNVGKYFPDHMEWTWQDEQTDASVITGGTEATKQCYGLFLQSNTATPNYRPIVMGTTQTTDTTKLNTTITGQGYVSNLMFSKPDTGYLYATVFSSSSYIDGTGVQLTSYGLYAKSYKKVALPAGGDYSYSRYIIRIHDGKAADNSGMLLTMDSGGLTIVGGGESATSLASLISDDQRDSNTSRTRLNVGGTLNTSYHGCDEHLILSSDYNIYFLTNCNNVGNRKPVVLDGNSYFYPGTTKTGSLGTSSYYWGSAYIDSLYLSKTSELNTASGDALYFAKRTDTDVSISFGVGPGGVNHGIYSYKLGGWIIYGDASNVYVRSTAYNPTTKSDYFAIPFFGATPSTGGKAIYNNNGLRYSTLEGTTSQPGIAHLIIGNGVASTSDANKEGIIRIYSVENGFVDLSAEASVESNTLTLPALTGTLRIQRNALQYDNSSDYASYSWHKFAETTSNVSNDDRYITFLVSRTFRGNVIGILTAHIRTSGTKIFASAEFEWSLANKGIIPSNFVMVYTDTANTSCKVELWYKQEARYDGWIFEVLKENTRVAIDHDDWTLYSTVGHGSATYTSGTGTIISTLGKIKNAPGIYAVKGTQTASTSSWTGSIDVSELYDGLTIAYYLPYASTSTSVTLNLTLADGTKTGAINCYYTSTSRITTHYAVGATIVLTYWSAGSISVNGTATTDDRWVRCEYSTTSANQTNTTTNADYRVLFSANANDTTQTGTTRKNINLKYNPSTANLKIGAFVSGSTATEDGKLTFGNSSNVYTHTINTDITKVNNISLLLNDANGVMGTDTLCYKGYESENLSSDTEPGALTAISSLPDNVSFSGYLARFSYFTILLCVGTDVTQRLTINLTAVSGYQSFQLIWGGAPSSSGGQLCMTSGLANITDKNGTITITLTSCNSYWYISSSSSALTRGSTPGLHILKVYGHSIRSQGYH